MNLPRPAFPCARAAPRQRQLIQRLKQAILAGQLPAGGKLPSSRTLADELDISRNTVLIAYEQLTAEGYVVADRQGTRVAPCRPPRPAPPARPNRRNRRPSPPRGWAASPPPACPTTAPCR